MFYAGDGPAFYNVFYAGDGPAIYNVFYAGDGPAFYNVFYAGDGPAISVGDPRCDCSVGAPFEIVQCAALCGFAAVNVSTPCTAYTNPAAGKRL